MPRLYVTGKAITEFKIVYEMWIPPKGYNKSYTDFMFWLIRGALLDRRGCFDLQTPK